jgi:hypothetical protein
VAAGGSDPRTADQILMDDRAHVTISRDELEAGCAILDEVLE